MKIDVLRIAELSNLNINEDELERFSNQMSDIIDMISDLPDTDSAVIPEKQVMPLRKDEVLKSLTADEALMNAPEAFDGCFAVLRVID